MEAVTCWIHKLFESMAKQSRGTVSKGMCVATCHKLFFPQVNKPMKEAFQNEFSIITTKRSFTISARFVHGINRILSLGTANI